jgi:HTH-type transcriptional regulator/antitoxin HipB
MRIRHSADLGAFIRERRTLLGLDQASLAKAAGTSRKWLVEMEQGKARAELGLVLKTLQALDVAVHLEALSKGASDRAASKAGAIGPMLDALKRRP